MESFNQNESYIALTFVLVNYTPVSNALLEMLLNENKVKGVMSKFQMM